MKKVFPRVYGAGKFWKFSENHSFSIFFNIGEKSFPHVCWGGTGLKEYIISVFEKTILVSLPWDIGDVLVLIQIFYIS